MTCPACSAVLAAGQDRCSACGAIVSPPSEGSLAPDPLSVTPPARSKLEPLREIPGLRKNKKEKTWKDEVRERVRHRKRQRSGDDLPLFRESDDEAPPAEAPSAEAPPEPDEASDPHAVTERVRMKEIADVVAELAIRPAGLDAPVEPEPRGRTAGPDREETPLRETPPSDEPSSEWSLETPPQADVRPVERPARLGERFLAAALDLALLLGLWAVVVYFASRAARAPLAGLLPAWPYLAGYLAFLGLVYATYFTGTTGQTLGKIAGGLRVVDTAGRPPGYVRAFVRALVAAIGIAAAFAGLLPMLFDPARRALHDRLLRTRVVKS